MCLSCIKLKKEKKKLCRAAGEEIDSGSIFPFACWDSIEKLVKLKPEATTMQRLA